MKYVVCFAVTAAFIWLSAYSLQYARAKEGARQPVITPHHSKQLSMLA